MVSRRELVVFAKGGAVVSETELVEFVNGGPWECAVVQVVDVPGISASDEVAFGVDVVLGCMLPNELLVLEIKGGRGSVPEDVVPGGTVLLPVPVLVPCSSPSVVEVKVMTVVEVLELKDIVIVVSEVESECVAVGARDVEFANVIDGSKDVVLSGVDDGVNDVESDAVCDGSNVELVTVSGEVAVDVSSTGGLVVQEEPTRDVIMTLSVLVIS